MVDITMCLDHECPLRDGCYRYTAKPADVQTYSNWGHHRLLLVDPFTPPGIPLEEYCYGYMPLKEAR